MGVFAMPSLGADMEAGKLAEWLVSPGDSVRRGDVIAVVETQKGAIEIEVFEDGTVADLTAEVGQDLPVGAPLATILAPGETAQEAAPSPAPEPEPEAKSEPASPPEGKSLSAALPPAPARAPVAPAAGAASPAARLRARDLGVDLTGVTGTGPGGAILLSDIEALSPDRPKAPARTSSPADEMRRAIAAAMTRSKRTIPHFYMTQTFDVQPVTDWLAATNADRPPARRLLLGALLVRATAVAARKVKVLNGHYTDDGFAPSDAVTVGVAIALRGGWLVAPALVDADAMTLDEVMDGMRDLVARARAGRLRSREMTAGTITVSSLGDTGAESMAGVIFPPQVALVGLGAPQTRPWVVDGAVVPRQVITLILSADHRAADGRQAAAFVDAFRTALAPPETP
jgi:pyruvate dehydrogenase E2 component (dihydrolipoamide acetyltransferase)